MQFGVLAAFLAPVSAPDTRRNDIVELGEGCRTFGARTSLPYTIRLAVIAVIVMMDVFLVPTIVIIFVVVIIVVIEMEVVTSFPHFFPLSFMSTLLSSSPLFLSCCIISAIIFTITILIRHISIFIVVIIIVSVNVVTIIHHIVIITEVIIADGVLVTSASLCLHVRIKVYVAVDVIEFELRTSVHFGL